MGRRGPLALGPHRPAGHGFSVRAGAASASLLRAPAPVPARVPGLGALPELGVAAIVLTAEMMCYAAAQVAGTTPQLLISAVGLLCSAGLTLTYRESMDR